MGLPTPGPADLCTLDQARAACKLPVLANATVVAQWAARTPPVVVALGAPVPDGDSSRADDQLLADLITGISAKFKRYCSRQLISAAVTEVLDGNNRNALCVRQYPITSIASLSVNERAISAAASSISNGFIYDPIGIIYLNGYTFGRGNRNVTVTYNAGYRVAGQGITQTTEEIEALKELAMLCSREVAWKYASRDRYGYKSQQFATFNVAYITDELLPETEQALFRFKSKAPAI